MSWLFGCVEKQFGKIRVILTYLKSESGKQTIAMHVLPKISGRKSNQAMKICQLIEHNMRNNFPEKSYAKSKLSISLDK